MYPLQATLGRSQRPVEALRRRPGQWRAIHPYRRWPSVGLAGLVALGAWVLLCGNCRISAAEPPGEPGPREPLLAEPEEAGTDEEEAPQFRLFNDPIPDPPEKTPGPVNNAVFPGAVAPTVAGSVAVRSRLRAVEAWGQAGDAPGVAHCLEALRDPHPMVRRYAARALTRCDPSLTLQAVLDKLSRGDARDIRALDEALPLLRTSLEAPMMEVLRKGERRGMSHAAAYGLGRMGSVAAGPLLAKVTWSEDTGLAALCADAMVRTASEKAVPGYIRLTRHPNPDMRMAAVHALGRTNGPRTAVALEEVACGEVEPTREVREAAVSYLGTVGDDHTVTELIGMMRRFTWIRPAAARALRRLTGVALGTSPEEWEQWCDTAIRPLLEPDLPPLSSGDAGPGGGQDVLAFPKMEAGDIFRGVPGVAGSQPAPTAPPALRRPE